MPSNVPSFRRPGALRLVLALLLAGGCRCLAYEVLPPTANPCLEANGGCDAKATCTFDESAPAHRTCACAPGWIGDGVTCTDRDECAAAAACPEHARCVNTPGSFECPCVDGYGPHDGRCIDVDECRENNGGCDAHATCTNTDGGRTCACSAGWTGDGESCEDVDECATGKASCQAHASCVNDPGAFHCTCDAGYVADGAACRRQFAWVSAGSNTSCAAAADDGSLYCWGENHQHLVTPDLPLTVASPTKVTSPGGFVEVHVGRYTACARRADGSLWCWGRNDSGEAGSGNSSPQPAPTRVGTATDWSAVDLFEQHACGLRAGAVYCWGANATGQLGVGDKTRRTAPTRVGTDSDWTRVVTGDLHSCALKADGRLFCWGANAGRLGIGVLGDTMVPVEVGGRWRDVAAGAHTTCGIRDEGSLACWGDSLTARNLTGSTDEYVLSPRTVGNGANWRTLAAGADGLCAVKQDGTLWCGGNNASAQVGDGTLEPRDTLQPVGPGRAWASVDARKSPCARTVDGIVACWGTDAQGAAGSGRGGLRLTPQVISPESRFTRVACASQDTCVIRSDSALLCAGNGRRGRTGLGSEVSTPTFTELPGRQWTEVALNGAHGCALKGDRMWCWGSGTRGELGLGPTANLDAWTPRLVGSFTDSFVAVALGADWTCGIRTSRALACWGANTVGQLGDGTTTDRLYPAAIAAGTTWSAISAGEEHTCGVQTDGSLWCWGANSDGRLGDSGPERHVPTRVGTRNDWKDVRVSGYRTCAVSTGGALQCWGLYPIGPLASGAAWTLAVPNDNLVLALRGGGELWDWGLGLDGMLGIGSIEDVPSPARVGDAHWSAFGLAEDHACGLHDDGTLWCWGSPGDGQFGDGLAFVTTPTSVADP